MNLDYDFEYDGRLLSDAGFILCTFDSPGLDAPDSGARITFTTVSRNGGEKYFLAGTKYDSCIQSDFSICKNPDVYLGDDFYITDNEYREIVRWLNRKDFHKFRLIDYDGFEGERCHFYASFNLKKRMLANRIVGIDLEMETNAPFGFGDMYTCTIDASDTSGEYKVSAVSDDEGIIYPNMEITCLSDGDLQIRNEDEDIDMVVKGCKNGEIITIDGETLVISSSLPEHKLEKDFNFIFFRLRNAYRNLSNTVSVTLSCKIKLFYEPIIKDTPF